MKKILTTTLMITCLGALLTYAQNTSKQAGCNAVLVSDNSHPVWKALDAQYAKLADAMRKKDFETLFSLYTPDYQVKMPNGEVWNREKSLAYQKGGLQQVRETAHISNTILRVSVCGDEATPTVLQQWYRMQVMAGKLRRV